MKNLEVIGQVKEYIRHPYAWPGGYPKVLVMNDGDVLCASCAHKDFRLIVAATSLHSHDGWCAVGVDINWEDPDCYCAGCGRILEPAYGSDD